MYKLILFFSLLFSASFLYAQTAKADYQFGEAVYINDGDSLSSDLFFFGRTLEYSAFSSNDVVGAGQSVHISGTVGDDLYAGGETVRIDGTVEDGVLIWAKEIIVSGVIKGDARLWGGNVHIMEGAEIFGDTYVGTGGLRIDKAILHGNLKGGSYTIHLNGEIAGDIEYGAGAAPYFGENFKSSGKASFVLKREPGTEMGNAPANLEIILKPEPRFFGKGAFYWFLVSAFVIGALIIALFGQFYQHVSEIGQNKTLVGLGTGFVFTVAFPFIVLFSILFLPMAFILGALYLIILYLAKIMAAFIFGSFISKTIFKKEMNPYLSFAIGLVILSLLYQIPFLGGVVFVAAFLLGSGALLMYFWQLRKAAV
ncbi:MAG: hypothetical protein D8M58_10405 [Calditrichaeota bacterium]|nr:MAG: hypothetical protein DWQ03_09780 [Calditrichota bacterium]MBL1205801.1 hypothetical protein [Calditrichota bacterium]NOG45629.1 hypothetical protein [Calditrichota bacterium]